MNSRSVIANCKVFSRLSASSLDLLASSAKMVTIAKGSFVFQQDEKCAGIYCVGKGLVRVFKTAPSGKEHILHFAEPCQTFAEVAVIGGFNCPAHADALEDSICALIPADFFRRQLETNHELCLQFTQGMAFWIRRLINLMEDIVLRDAAGRVAGFLVKGAANEQNKIMKLPKKDIASHLNITSETFSRVLRRFAELDLITTSPTQRVVILNTTKLIEISEGVFPSELE